jgi:hypothetical protein
VGLLGSYFGTPTTKAGSGTEEEFHQAYKLYRDHPENIRVLIYFKNTSPNIFEINWEQFEKVKSFRKDLQRLGVLYGSFSDGEDLYRKLVSHLSLLVEKQWTGSNWKVLSEAPVVEFSLEAPDESSLTLNRATGPVLATEEPSEEDGFFELLDSGMRAALQITATLESMTSDSTSFQESIARRATELEASIASSQAIQQAAVFDGLASDLSKYDATLREKVPVLDAAQDETLSSLVRLSRLVASEAPQGRAALAEILPSFGTMAASVRQSRDVIVALQASVNSAPPMTKKLRRAKRSLAEAIEGLIASVTVFGVKANVVVRDIGNALGTQ